MKRFLKYFLMVTPILMVLAVYSKLPAQVPMHWGIDGNVDRYGDKIELFLLAGMNILMFVLMHGVPKIDPKRVSYEKFQGTHEWIIIWIMAFFTVIMGVTLMEALHPGRFEMGKVVCTMVGFLFITMGSMMHKVKRNFFTGIKTPWSLSSDEVWDKTHRLSGKCFVLGGIFMVIAALVGTGKIMFAATIGVIIVITVVPIVMSYIWYQKEMEE